jgi:hypothetical protein
MLCRVPRSRIETRFRLPIYVAVESDAPLYPIVSQDGNGPRAMTWFRPSRVLGQGSVRNLCAAERDRESR